MLSKLPRLDIDTSIFIQNANNYCIIVVEKVLNQIVLYCCFLGQKCIELSKILKYKGTLSKYVQLFIVVIFGQVRNVHC